MGCCFTGTGGKTNTDRETCEALGGVYHGDADCILGDTGQDGPEYCFIKSIFQQALSNQIMGLGNVLQDQYDFREHVLNPTEKGKRYIELYYMYNPIAKELILNDPRLMGDSIATFWELIPVIKNIVNEAVGNEIVEVISFTKENYLAVEALLRKMQNKSTHEGFKKTVDESLEDLKQLVGIDTKNIICVFNQAHD